MIELIEQGSLAKSRKTNEVIKVLNALAKMEIRFVEGDKSELVLSDTNCILQLSKSNALPEGYEEASVILCQDGSPVNGSILFKAD